jgi:hypothetical protein
LAKRFAQFMNLFPIAHIALVGVTPYARLAAFGGQGMAAVCEER